MMNRLLVLFFGMLISASSFAATVSLSPTPSNLAGTNSTISVDLVLDVADAPGGHVLGSSLSGLYAGSVKLGYDPSFLTFTSFTLNSSFGTQFLPPGVDASIVGEIAVHFFDADFDLGNLGTFEFGTTSFAGTHALTLADNNALGSFENQVDGSGSPTNEKFTPLFIGTSLETMVIPLPAAFWLLLSGFGLLFTMSKSKARH